MHARACNPILDRQTNGGVRVVRRRELLRRAWGFGVCGAAALVCAGAPLQLRLLVAAGVGSAWDQSARNLAAAMQQAGLVSSVQFDNRSGSGGIAGLAQFASASKDDAHALMIGGVGLIGSIALNRPPYQLGMVTPIARLTTEYLVFVVPASSRLQSMRELAEQWRSNLGSVTLGGGPLGGADHLLASLAAAQLGLEPAQLQYRAFDNGGDAQSGVIDGAVTAAVAGYGEYAAQIKSGKLRALAISGGSRLDGIATLKEQGIDLEFGNWRGVFAPAGISTAQRDAWVELVRQALETPLWRATSYRLGWVPVPLYGDDFKRLIEAETSRIERALGIPAPKR
jgi:putative tricarboxylic transport membrane protein